MNKLLIIDSNSLLHRSYHALPPLKTKQGEMVNAAYGFLSIFLKAVKEFNPDYVVGTFDLPGPTFRHKQYKEYKAGRPVVPEELYSQIDIVKETLKAFELSYFEKKGYEADDIIGTIVTSAPKDTENIIVSGDLDLLQLVGPRTRVWTMKKGIKDITTYTPDQVRERYGISPSQLIELKALQGDSSDNIPGVAGIGKKGASSLIGKFGNLETLYKNLSEEEAYISKSVANKLKNEKEKAFLSRALSKIKTDVPLDFNLESCKFPQFDRSRVVEKLRDLEFSSLIDRLPGEVSQSEEKGLQGKIKSFYEKRVFSERIYNLEKKLICVVEGMEKRGIKVDAERFSRLSEELEEHIRSIRKEIYKFAGEEFNINSPSQVSEVLFDKLNIPSKKIRKTSGGDISTAASELEILRDEYLIVDLILKYREFFKLKSSFVDTLPKLVGKDGRIHPDFEQLGTETGRMSCKNPNLQNIPSKSEWGEKIRKCFVPKEGFKFISADYSQIEMRVAAILSGDEKMRDFFKEGGDFHTLTASEVFDVDIGQVSRQQRKIAKSLNFGVIYGLGAKGFSRTAGVSYSEAKEFIEKYFKEFSQLKEYRDSLIQKAREEGHVETLWGRKRFLPEINSVDPRMRAGAEREALNMPIQGTQADIIKMAMVGLEEEGVLDERCRLLVQIHDELLFEVDSNIVKDKGQKIKKIMESIVDWELPIKVDVSLGKSWGQLRNFEL